MKHLMTIQEEGQTHGAHIYENKQANSPLRRFCVTRIMPGHLSYTYHGNVTSAENRTRKWFAAHKAKLARRARQQAALPDVATLQAQLTRYGITIVQAATMLRCEAGSLRRLLIGKGKFPQIHKRLAAWMAAAAKDAPPSTPIPAAA